MDLSSNGSRFNTMIMSGELRKHFSHEELREMSAYVTENSSLSFSDLFDDATTVCSSYPNSRGEGRFYIKTVLCVIFETWLSFVLINCRQILFYCSIHFGRMKIEYVG